MKITIVGEKLQNSISRAEKITAKNPSLPILRAVLLIASGNTLKIRATNLEIGLELSVPAKIHTEGIVAVPGDTLNTLLTAGGYTGPVEITESGTTITLTAPGKKTTIKTLPHDEFPLLPNFSKTKTVTLDSRDLVRGLQSVWYSASTVSIKPELASVFIHKNNNELVFVATDSFRLAEKKIALKKDVSFNNLLIPYKNVPEIIRNIEGKGDVEVVFGENQITLTTEDTYITSRVVNATFPDYQQIIPREETTGVVMLKQDFIGALRVANIFSNKFNQIRFFINPKQKKFLVQTTNPDVGESEILIPAALTGEDVEVAFNSKYLIDALQSVGEDSIHLRLDGASKPLIIRGAGDTTFTYLVMPMNR